MHGQRNRPAAPVRPPGETLQGVPLDVLHREEVTAVVAPDLQGLNDVGVAQAGGEPRLLEEHRDEDVVVDELRPQLLDHEQLGEPGRPLEHGEVHHPHAPAGNLGDETILAQVSGGLDGSGQVSGARHGLGPGKPAVSLTGRTSGKQWLSPGGRG